MATREFDAADRRRVTLALTGRGNAILQAAHAVTQAYLAEVLSALSLTEQEVVAQAMPRFFASNVIYPISIMPAWQHKPTTPYREIALGLAVMGWGLFNTLPKSS